MAQQTTGRAEYRSVPLRTDPQPARAGERTKPRRYYDYSLVFVVLILSAFGLLMIYSSSYYTASINPNIGEGAFYMKKQLWNLLAGLAVMIGLSLFDYHFWAKWWLMFLAYGAGLVVMLLTNFTSFGLEYNGAKRWFGIGNTSLFQPAEPLKLALILVFAYALALLKNRVDRLKYAAILLAMAAVPIFLVFMNNLSSAIILAVIVLGMMFTASQKKWPFAALVGFVALVAVLGVVFAEDLVARGVLKEYQVSRILVWKNPEQYASSGGWQVLQGLYAIGSGGLFGKGLGNGVQKLGFVPEAQNDMIFAIICEELGLFGALCVILLFVYMFYRFMIIARNAPDTLGVLLVAGVFVHIAVQVVLNIAVVTNFIPNTGVTLPFISYGGTSILFLMAEVGLVLSVAHRVELRD